MKMEKDYRLQFFIDVQGAEAKFTPPLPRLSPPSLEFNIVSLNKINENSIANL